MYNSTTDTDVQVYALTTAYGDVAALMNNSSGSVVERYAYDPYGSVTFLTPTYGSRSSSSYGWVYLHQGLRWDSIVDLYDNRAQAYSPTLMRFLQNDPIGFMAGDPNTYRYEGDGPTDGADPTGLDEFGIGDPNERRRIVQPVAPVPVNDPGQFDLTPDAGGPSNRILVSSIIQIADYLDKHMKKGQCLNRIQIGAHGRPGILSNKDGSKLFLSNVTFAAAQLYLRDPSSNAYKEDAQIVGALYRIQTHLCAGGRIEFIGCTFVDPRDSTYVKAMNGLEAIFGKGNVIGYDKEMIWDGAGDAVTQDEWNSRYPIRATLGSINEALKSAFVSACENMVHSVGMGWAQDAP